MCSSPSQSGVGLLQDGVASHEDDIMQVSLDVILVQEEAAEQDVLAQLRQRAAGLERDLLHRALDGVMPNSKVGALQESLSACILLMWWCTTTW